MPLNLVQICQVKFPGQIEQDNITFRQPDGDILFDTWNVPNVPRPTEAEILAEEPQWEKPYAIFSAFNMFVAYIENLLNQTAVSKQYGSAVACATYATSSNPQWAAEAKAFIDWRDAVFVYSIDIQTKVLANQIPIPTLDEFVAGLPTISWPS